jgi:hypothetical protein
MSTHHTLIVLLTDGTHRVTQWFDAHPDQYSGVGGALYEATRLQPAESATYFAGTIRAQFNASQIMHAVRLHCGLEEPQS